MSFSNQMEDSILDLLFNGIGFFIGVKYLGLAYEPIDESTGANCGEVNINTSPEYIRLPLPSVYWTASSSGRITNALAISWPYTLTAWGTVTHFVIFDTQTVGRGQIVIYGMLDTTWQIVIGSEPRFDIGDIEITLD